jgi:Family of unknown function (DUF6516)
MPAATFPEYVQDLEKALHATIASGEGILLSLQVDQRSAVRGFVSGSLQFPDGSTLSFREFVDISQAEPKLMYAYHYQDASNILIFRYDNAVHRPALPQSGHKHTQSGIEVAPVPTLSVVLDQILKRGG